MKTLGVYLCALLTTLLLVNPVSAIVIDSVDSDNLFPGKTGSVTIGIQNVFDEDIEDVTLSLDFTDLPLIAVGSSSMTTDEIKDNDDQSFTFNIRAANDIKPGDYSIPYTITYNDGSDPDPDTKTGSIGITVDGNTELTFSVEPSTPVVGREGTITFTIVNKGFADARFVSVTAYPEGYNLLSEENVYIGTIDSDDFETATFDVSYRNEKARFVALVEYTDFNNQKIEQTIDLPLNIYSQEKAIELGIIQRSKSGLYVGIVIALIILWFLWRWIRKRRRMKRSMER